MALPSLTRDPWGPYTDLAHIAQVEQVLGTDWLSKPGMPTGVEDPFKKLVENQNTAITQEYNQQRIDAEKKKLADEAMAQAELQSAEGSDLDTLGGIAKKLGDVQLMMNVEKEKSSRANVEADNKRAVDQAKNNAYSVAAQLYSRGEKAAGDQILIANGMAPLEGDFRKKEGSSGNWVSAGVGVDPSSGKEVRLQRNSKTGEERVAPLNYNPRPASSNSTADMLSALLGVGGKQDSAPSPAAPQTSGNIPVRRRVTPVLPNQLNLNGY